MGKPLRVLIVEDFENDAILLLRQLRRDGYDPSYERLDTIDALDAALSNQSWDVVLSDYMLPRLTGLDTLNLLKKKKLDIPCIIVSGRITEETAVEAMRAGARDYIMKDNLKRLGLAIERELEEVAVRRERNLAEERTRALSSRLLNVQEEERRNIARELHDEIGQSLTGLKMLVTQASRSRSGNVNTILNETQDLLTELIRQVREMSLKLRPSMLDDLGLLPTLLWHFDRYTKQTNVQVSFEHSGLENNLEPDVKTAVYRIIQEALTNVARYSGMSEVSVQILADDGLMHLKIEDQGRGFDMAEIVSKASTGIGGMQERVQLLGGTFVIKTRPGEGTFLDIHIPLHKGLSQ
jgi:signal transduction histidine kinase